MTSNSYIREMITGFRSFFRRFFRFIKIRFRFNGPSKLKESDLHQYLMGEIQIPKILAKRFRLFTSFGSFLPPSVRTHTYTHTHMIR